MPDYGQAQFIEVLSVARVRTDQEQRAVVITIRPEPDRSWAFHHLGLTVAQAERLRDDLTTLLKAPAAFILIAFVALASAGCSAKVEVAAESESAADQSAAAVEKQSVVVEVDVLGKQQPEQAAQQVGDDHRAAKPNPMLTNLGGIQINGDKNTIEFHFHRHRRSRSPMLIYPIVRHEMIIVPGGGTAPVRFSDNAPPRITLTDKEVARAYAVHMLKLAEREGLP